MAYKKAQKQVILESVKRYEHSPQRYSPLIPAKLLEDPLLNSGGSGTKTKSASSKMDANISNGPKDIQSSVKTTTTSANGNEDSSNSSSEGEEGGPRRAPTLLIMEFIECLMKKNYKAAHKLCKMILLYEPENKDAINFLPVIEMKLRQDSEDALNESSDESSEIDDDEDDDESSESSDEKSGDWK